MYKQQRNFYRFFILNLNSISFTYFFHLVAKYFKKSESDWIPVWTIPLNYMPMISLRFDPNATIILSIDGIVDKLSEEKSNPVLKTITSLQR